MPAFEYFVSYLLAPLIFGFGLAGNLLGFTIFSNSELNQIGPRLIYKSLFLMDTFMITLIWQPYFSFGFNKDLTLVSDMACHIYWYIDYIVAPISPILLCYISIERVASVVYSNKILKEKYVQIIALAVAVIFNFLYYIEVAFWYQINSVSSENSTLSTNETDNKALLSCNFKDIDTQNIISFMDLTNRVLVPFPFMMFTTIWLIYKIVTTRSRVLLNNATKQERHFNKQIKFSVTAVSLNIIYLILSLPLSVEVFLPQYNSDAYLLVYLVVTYMFYAGYSINFYIILATNKLVRKEFYHLVRISPKANTKSISRTST